MGHNRAGGAVAEGVADSEEVVVVEARGALFTLLTNYLFSVRMASANAKPFRFLSDDGKWAAHEV